MSDPKTARALRDATQKTLRDLGFADDEVRAAWEGRTGVPLRDARVQLLLRKAALWDSAQARAKQVTKAPIPPVLRPGVHRPKGNMDLEQITRLERELGDAKGDRAIRLATKLTQLRRGTR